MSYIDSNLLPDETIVFRTKKHLIVFLIPVVFFLLALFFAIDTAFTTPINALFDSFTATIPILHFIHRLPSFIFFIAGLFSSLQQWILYTFSEYVVTTKRVVMREGLLIRLTADLRLETISSVNIDQGVLAQLFNYGNISINGFGGQTDVFMQIAKPIAFQKSVHGQLRK